MSSVPVVLKDCIMDHIITVSIIDVNFFRVGLRFRGGNPKNINRSTPAFWDLSKFALAFPYFNHLSTCCFRAKKPTADPFCLQPHLIFLCQQDGLRECGHIDAINHVIVPHGGDVSFNTFLACGCPLEGVFDFVNIGTGGKEIPGDQDAFDGSAGKGKVYFQKSAPCF